VPTGSASTAYAPFARALEHIHLGWTVVAWLLLTPGIAQLAQLLVDARGAARLGAPSR